MNLDIRAWLYDRGFVRCDRCASWIMWPRGVAMVLGWFCGGEAGNYDYCPRCLEIMEKSRQYKELMRDKEEGCWAGEEGAPMRVCGLKPVGPSGLCEQHVKELSVDG